MHWLDPCKGDELVPDEIKNVFNILNSIADEGTSAAKSISKLKKGAGKKGDAANPKK